MLLLSFVLVPVTTNTTKTVRGDTFQLVDKSGDLQFQSQNKNQSQSRPGAGNITASICTWKRDNSAALSLTFDDGLSCHYRHAVPLLSERGLKGTFFVTTGNIGIAYGAQWNEWAVAALLGHEIGAHTITHPDLTTVSDEGLREETVHCKALIEEHIPFASCQVFSYPYGSYDDRVLDVVKAHFIAARTDAHNLTGRPGPLNATPGNLYTIVPVNFGTNESASCMNRFVEETILIQGWLVEMIHAVGDEGFERISIDDFTAHLDYLAANTDEVWVDTFGAVAKYIQARKSSECIIIPVSDTRFSLHLSSSLDPSIYDEPLTVKITVPSDWDDVNVKIGKRTFTLAPEPDGEVKSFLLDIPVNSTAMITKDRSSSSTINPILASYQFWLGIVVIVTGLVLISILIRGKKRRGQMDKTHTPKEKGPG